MPKRFFSPPRPPTDDDADSRICDHPHCSAIGQYPAPKSRHNLSDYFFFCLTHVRLYNKHWNYYDGMTQAQIEADRQADIIGHRPLWNYSLGARAKHDNKPADNPYAENDRYRHYRGDTRAALDLLQPPIPVTLNGIKSTYKNWVKRLHPDSHKAPQNQKTQDKLKQINYAYAVLKLAFAKHTR